MASRRLALNLSQGLRGRAGLNVVAPLRRGFATPVVQNGVKTESTTLSNGLTVGCQAQGNESYGSLTLRRLQQNIPHGRRLQLSVFGLMRDLVRRRIKPMALPTFSSILPSRFAFFYGAILVEANESRVLATGHNNN